MPASGDGQLGQCIGSDGVRWSILANYAGGRGLYHDRSLGRNYVTGISFYYTEHVTAAGDVNNLGLVSSVWRLTNVCTLGAIPILVRSHAALAIGGLGFDGKIDTRVSFD